MPFSAQVQGHDAVLAHATAKAPAFASLWKGGGGALPSTVAARPRPAAAVQQHQAGRPSVRPAAGHGRVKSVTDSRGTHNPCGDAVVSSALPSRSCSPLLDSSSGSARHSAPLLSPCESRRVSLWVTVELDPHVAVRVCVCVRGVAFVFSGCFCVCVLLLLLCFEKCGMSCFGECKQSSRPRLKACLRL
jgi:hypothetical protein